MTEDDFGKRRMRRSSSALYLQKLPPMRIESFTRQCAHVHTERYALKRNVLAAPSCQVLTMLECAVWERFVLLGMAGKIVRVERTESF